MIKKRERQYPGKTKRINCCLDKRAHTLVSRVVQKSGHSFGMILSELILQKMEDPLHAIDEDIRHHARKLNELQDRRARLVDGIKADGGLPPPEPLAEEIKDGEFEGIMLDPQVVEKAVETRKEEVTRLGNHDHNLMKKEVIQGH